MYEYEIVLKTGYKTIICGTSYQNALTRFNIAANEVLYIRHQEHVDY